ncbi:MAG: HesA/MoeB/ThiF family protein [Bacteroidia bacterium]
MITIAKEEYTRYSRQIALPEIGFTGQEQLKAAKVLVIGAGGLGCPVLQYLSAAGIGHIGIVDFDRIELHNLHRQILYGTADVGKQKAETAAAKLKANNPLVTYTVFDTLLRDENAEAILRDFDVVIDGSDNFMTRYLVNDVCVKLNKPLVYGTIFNFQGQLAVFNYKGGKQLRDVFPEPPDAAEVPNCDENGVMGYVPGIIGLYMANAAIQVVLGSCAIENKLLIFDLEKFTLTALEL